MMSNEPMPTPEELSIAIAKLKSAQEELHHKHLWFWRLTDDLPKEYRPPTSDRVQMGQALEDFRIAMIRSTVQAKRATHQSESEQTVFIANWEMEKMLHSAAQMQTEDLSASDILICLLHKTLKTKGYRMSEHWLVQEEAPNGFYFKFGDRKNFDGLGPLENTCPA
jgi:hypothetical protein